MPQNISKIGLNSEEKKQITKIHLLPQKQNPNLQIQTTIPKIIPILHEITHHLSNQ